MYSHPRTYRVLEMILLVLLGITIGLALHSIFFYEKPWDRGATGGEKLLPIRQPPGPSCGPTSLAMVARTWGIPLSKREAAILARMTPRGTSMSNLVRAGRSLDDLMLRIQSDIQTPSDAYWREKENTDAHQKNFD